MSSTSLTPLMKREAATILPDTDRYKLRMDIRSGSSNRLYRVSYDAAPGAGYWVCSCRGCVAHGMCRHLRAIGVRGRKFGKISLENSIQQALYA